MNKRLRDSLLLGAVLGIFCIIGIGLRLGFEGNALFLFSAWYNRVILGLVIGLAAPLVFIKGSANRFIRGGVLGLLVSFAWFASTDFIDPLGFAAGIVYGVIIDALITNEAKTKIAKNDEKAN